MTFSKNALPSVLVTAGPVNPTIMKTGWCGTAASSSASVGSRTSLNWLGLKPPIVVMKLSALTGGFGLAGSVDARDRVEGLHVRDRGGVLQRRVVPGPVAHQHEVVVAVDQPRHRHPPVQVDDLRLPGELALRGGEAVADVGHETAADREHAGDGAVAVHGVDAAVAEDQVLRRRGSAAG